MVFVLDKRKRPLMPCSEKRARLLLQKGKAVVHKMFPFTIRLKERLAQEINLQSLRMKLDPGSKTTGVAILREESQHSTVIWLAEISHKTGIKHKLDVRRAVRRSRRNRKTRYRRCKFCIVKKSKYLSARPKGWLPPSLVARVNQTINAVAKLRKLLPITSISTEHVKFDTQLMQNPEISSVEYQQGELQGYEVKEYLLEKFGRKCAYCGATNVPLEAEHYIAKARGGTDRVSNLAISCHDCNQEKGKLLPKEWVEKLRKSGSEKGLLKAENVLKLVGRLKEPLRDAAMMNATRWRLFEKLKETGLPVECGTGARTKMQRIKHELPKEHYFDAACIGAITPEVLTIKPAYVDVWSAIGRGSRQMCITDKYGFPKCHRPHKKFHYGFQTGDMVVADIPKGKYVGRYSGRVAVRTTGYFDLKDSKGKRICQGISYKYFKILQRSDGWQYEKKLVG